MARIVVWSSRPSREGMRIWRRAQLAVASIFGSRDPVRASAIGHLRDFVGRRDSVDCGTPLTTSMIQLIAPESLTTFEGLCNHRIHLTESYRSLRVASPFDAGNTTNR